MRGDHLITKSEQYALVYEKGSAWKDDLLVMRGLPNGLPLSRYGLSVSRRVGKAVVRNRVRRRLREILRSTLLKPGWDIVLVVRPKASAAEFAALRESVVRLSRRAGLLAEEHEEACLRSN